MAGRWLLGLAVVAGLMVALVIGLPSMSHQPPASTQHSVASHGC